MRYVWALVVLAVLTVIAILLSMSVPRSAPSPQSAPLRFPKYAPAPKAADAVVMQKGFNALVSFTGGGFEPATLTIKKGQTIRFTDNASAPLQLTSSNGNLFSGRGSIAPHNYAEVTFSQSGQFYYSDAQSGITGTVVVQ